jgi:predicted secreted protein
MPPYVGTALAAGAAILPVILLWRFPGTLGWALGFAIYFVVWWTVLFAVLPFHVKTQGEAGDVVPGTPESAPASVRLQRIFAANTVVASIAFTLIWLSIRLRLIPLDTPGLPGG